ncbi:unnamed protein product [Symbiodinium natans]|uniref:Uncharacterized protein n=1 Tax=Symbiodinium natans TaxID=878477 RepID=A0A812UPS6_9DINO|nr:unnamed protein product [Symbiodinium natans]
MIGERAPGSSTSPYSYTTTLLQRRWPRPWSALRWEFVQPLGWCLRLPGCPCSDMGCFSSSSFTGSISVGLCGRSSSSSTSFAFRRMTTT